MKGRQSMTEAKYGREQKYPKCGKLNPSGKKLPEECLQCNDWMEMFSSFGWEMHIKVEMQREVNQLKEENAKLREALEVILQTFRTTYTGPMMNLPNIHQIAKQALEE